MFCKLLLQNILHGALWVNSCSLVHFEGFWAVLSGFWSFLVSYLVIFFLLSNEEVNKREEYGDSMRQFAMFGVNK
jgi:hypothetical protein